MFRFPPVHCFHLLVKCLFRVYYCAKLFIFIYELKAVWALIRIYNL